MESTTLKVENLKPIILKIGVPLSVSLAGVIYAWIIAKKTMSEKEPEKIDGDATETKNFHLGTITHDENSSCLEQDFIISGIRGRIEELKMRELALNLRFERYCEMKEQESMIMEIKNMLSLEIAHVEFLDREISSLEAENMRLENFAIWFLTVVEKLKYRISENMVIRRKVQKIVKKSRAQSRVIKDHNMKIKAGETEILRKNDEVQTKICVINKLEDEIKELKGVLNRFQDEKNELLNNLEIAEKAYESKIEEGYVSKEDYNKILNELEQIKKERTAEVKELIRLKHELKSLNEQQQHDHQDRDHIGLEFEEGNGLHYESDHELHYNNNNMHCFGSPHHSEQHGFSRRKRLLRRLKRFVEGNDKQVRVKPDEGENHQLGKFLGMHYVPARRSCSSA